MKKIIASLFILILGSQLMAQPVEFDFLMSNSSALFLGQAQINGEPSSGDNWIAAFDSNGNCVGANPIIFSSGIGYISLIIYGDDPETEEDEGMVEGEDFTLKLWNESLSSINPYTENDIIVNFSGWENRNGQALLEYNDSETIYNFISINDIGCSNLIIPLDGTENVNTETLIKWFEVENATGYMISIGDEDGVYNFLDLYDAGSSSSIYIDSFECGKTYFVKITPYNDDNIQMNCSSESFSTMFSVTLAGPDTSICNGSSIELQGEGGLYFVWTPRTGLSDTTIANPIASPTTTTTYVLSSIHGNGCMDTDTVTIEVFAQPNANLTFTNETNNDANNGSASVNPTGGTAPYLINWSNGATSQSIINLEPGNYSVTVIDDNLCESINSIEILAYECVGINVFASISSVSCNGDCDGSILIDTIVNGAEPYTYAWSVGGISNGLYFLCSGFYSVTVTDDNGCTAVRSYIVNNPEVLDANLTSISESSEGANDGIVSANPIGGTAPYGYSWNNDSTTQVVVGLVPGNYIATVVDSKGCEDNEIISVDQFGCDNISALGTIFNITCNSECDGIITIDTVFGGVAPYSYNWSNGDTLREAQGLCAGDYLLTITDAENCNVFRYYEITEPVELFINLTVVSEMGSGNNNGMASVDPEGGVEPYVYRWSDGSTESSFSNLAPGDYKVSVTDFNNCRIIELFTIEEFECDTIISDPVITDLTCNGDNSGSIALNISGASQPILYMWSNGAETETIENLEADLYLVTVVDAHGCIFMDSIEIVQNEAIDLGLEINGESGHLTHDGEIITNVTGGALPYFFNWSTGENTSSIHNLIPGTYHLTMTDADQCQIVENDIIVSSFECLDMSIDFFVVDVDCYGDCSGSITITNISEGTFPFTYEWSNGEDVNNLIDKCAGTYSLTLTDANDCTLTHTFVIDEPEVYTLSTDFRFETAAGMNDGFINTTVEGGTSPYQYLWSNNATSKNISGLSGGQYTVTVTDANGCELTNTVELQTVDCDKMEINATVFHNKCHDSGNAYIDIIIENAIDPIYIDWSNGSHNYFIGNLEGGDYTVTVVDDYGCTVISEYTIETPDQLIVTIDELNHINDDNEFGSVYTTTTGGTAPYMYNWTGINGFTADTEDLIDLEVDCYHLELIDAQNCTSSLDLCIADLSTGVDEKEMDKFSVTLYPNPTRTYLNVDIDIENLRSIEAKLFDLSGKLLHSFNSINKEFKMDLSDINDGLYFIQLRINEGIIYKKIYIQK